MANKYITLTDSLTNGYKFKAIGMKTPQQRTDNLSWTLSGKLDKASGPVIRSYQYILRVPQQTDEAGYGTMDNLRTLFALSSSFSSPTDVVVLTDHYGATHNCYFVGELSPDPLTTILEGPNAWHIVQIALQEIP